MAFAPPREAAPDTLVEVTPAAVPHAAYEGAAAWRRRLLWLAAIGAAVAVGFQLTGGFPEGWVLDLTRPIESLENWTIDNRNSAWVFVHLFTPISHAIDTSFDDLVTLLLRMTWVGLIAALSAVAALVAGWRMAVLTAVGLFVMGLLGLWEASVQTLALVGVSVVIALAIGIPLGIWAGRSDRVDRLLRPLLDAAQVVPAFSYLIPLVLFFSIGAPPGVIATVIFAIPPAIRLTSLGIRGVPSSSLEVAHAFGSTKRQVLRKVQLPLAKPSIMLGVNQTIMMALGMIVIAAVVGVPGLGNEILQALSGLHVGEAFNAGLAIVALAIVLDRVTYAWSRRERRHPDQLRSVRLGGFVLPRWLLTIGALALVGVAVFVGRQVLRQQLFPAGWTTSVAAPTDAVVDWVTRTLGGVTTAITNITVKYLLDPLRSTLLDVPWWMVCGGAALLAWRISRRAGLTIMAFACLAATGVLGMWAETMDTLSQVVVAVVLSVALAIPIGIVCARSDGLQRVLKPVLDAMQTMPQFVYLVPVVALFGPGRVPGVIAGLVYALPPGIRLTDLGIRQVPRETVEAARSYGATDGQLLRKVQLPLARPSILLGVNQTIMMVLSVVIIAALIGGGGLGLEVYKGLTHDEVARGIVGGACILLLAIVIDRITQELGRERRAAAATRGGTRFGRLRAGRRSRAVGNTANASPMGKGEA